MNYFLIITISYLAQLYFVFCKHEIRVDVLQFENEGNYLLDGNFCNARDSSAKCSLFFIGCLSEAEEKEIPSCSLKEFESTEDALLSIKLHLDLAIKEIHLKIMVYDIVLGFKNLIDFFYFTIDSYNLSSSYHWYDGSQKFNSTRIRVGRRISCTDDLYTVHCNVSCRATDDCSGHFRCNQNTGDKICLDGWAGPYCNLSTTPLCSSLGFNEDIKQKSSGSQSVVDVIFVGDTSDSLFQKFVLKFLKRNLVGRNEYQFGIASINKNVYLKLHHKYSEAIVNNYFTDSSLKVNREDSLLQSLFQMRNEGFKLKNGARLNSFKCMVTFLNKKISTLHKFVAEIVEAKHAGIESYILVKNSHRLSYLKTDEITKTLKFITYNEDAITNSLLSTLVYIQIDYAKNYVGGNRFNPYLTAAANSSTAKDGDEFCSFNGKCSLRETCCCNDGYVGHYCEFEVNPCDSNPCNVGVCVKTNSTHFQCQCPTGFFGDKCENLLDPMTCEQCYIPSCIDKVGETHKYTQVQTPCLPFYYGVECQIFCRESKSCREHVVCDSNGNRICEKGWSNLDRNCSINEGFSAKSCPTTCLNSGYCYNSRCCCTQGFYGDSCELVISANILPNKIGSYVLQSSNNVGEIITICGIVFALLAFSLIFFAHRRRHQRKVNYSASSMSTFSQTKPDYIGHGIFRAF